MQKPGILPVTDHVVDLGINGRTLIWVHGLEAVDWIDLALDAGKWPALVNSNEPSCYINCGVLLDWLRNCQRLRKGSAPCS